MSYKTSFTSNRQKMSQRQQYITLGMSALAVLLVAIGLLLIWMWFSGRTTFAAIFATSTPTPTETPLPTDTPGPSDTPTISPIPSETLEATLAPTDTAIAPFQITVQAGDTLQGLAEQHSLDETIGWLIIMQYNGMDEAFLFAGQSLIIPHPDALLFTPTPIPALSAGTAIDYMVLPGDTGASIAAEFLSTLDGMIDANEGYYEERYGIPFNIDFLRIGDIIKVPIRLITPTFGPPPTEIPSGTATPEASTTP
jgi:LysM repeat protein